MAHPDQDQVFIAEAIRVTTVVNSTESISGEFEAKTIVIYNGLDQSVAIQLQGCLGDGNYIDIGDPFNVAAGIKDYETVTDYFPCYRITAQCTPTAPTTGTLDVWVLKTGG